MRVTYQHATASPAVSRCSRFGTLWNLPLAIPADSPGPALPPDAEDERALARLLAGRSGRSPAKCASHDILSEWGGGGGRFQSLYAL